MERETMEYDVVIVGGGPSGLATAIKFAQLNQEGVGICISLHIVEGRECFVQKNSIFSEVLKREQNVGGRDAAMVGVGFRF